METIENAKWNSEYIKMEHQNQNQIIKSGESNTGTWGMGNEGVWIAGYGRLDYGQLSVDSWV